MMVQVWKSFERFITFVTLKEFLLLSVAYHMIPKFRVGVKVLGKFDTKVTFVPRTGMFRSVVLSEGVNRVEFPWTIGTWVGRILMQVLMVDERSKVGIRF